MTRVRETRINDAWTPEQARALDELMRDVVAVLNRGVSIVDQFSTLKTGVRWNSDAAPITVGPFARPIKWVLCLGASQPTTPSVRTSGAPVEWTMRGQNVAITQVVGLTASTDYDLDLLCLEG
jgi:hypothetical protein